MSRSATMSTTNHARMAIGHPNRPPMAASGTAGHAPHHDVDRHAPSSEAAKRGRKVEICATASSVLVAENGRVRGRCRTGEPWAVPFSRRRRSRAAGISPPSRGPSSLSPFSAVGTEPLNGTRGPSSSNAACATRRERGPHGAVELGGGPHPGRPRDPSSGLRGRPGVLAVAIAGPGWSRIAEKPRTNSTSDVVECRHAAPNRKIQNGPRYGQTSLPSSSSRALLREPSTGTRWRRTSRVLPVCRLARAPFMVPSRGWRSAA